MPVGECDWSFMSSCSSLIPADKSALQWVTGVCSKRDCLPWLPAVLICKSDFRVTQPETNLFILW